MKRIIFVLLHCDGHYMLSRNFRLQRVGDIEWVLRNYEIRRVSLGIDELIILDVSPETSARSGFHRDVGRIVEECFVPVTVGGNLTSIKDVATCFAVGADKVLMNSAFFDTPELCEEVAGKYGRQALIASVDVIDDIEWARPGSHRPFVAREKLQAHVRRAINSGAGEVLLQSVDRDGTGKGLDVSLAEQAKSGTTPLILMGGVGQARHISEGLQSDAVDAVATANLLNFVGNALIDSRALAQMDGAQLATWLSERLESLRGVLRDADRPDTEVGAEVPHHC